MLPFDTAHMTSYMTLIETMRLACTIFVTIHQAPHQQLSAVRQTRQHSDDAAVGLSKV